MRFLKLFLAVLVFLPSVAKADIVFTLTPASQNIPSGTPVGQFNLFLSSNTPGGQVVNGVDVNAIASAGTFTSSPIFLFGGVEFDVLSIPGEAFSTSLAGNQTITTPVLYGTLNLDTSSLAVGNYTISLDQLNANNPAPSQPAHNSIGFGATFSITGLAAVPEPTSIVTAVALGFGGMFYRRRRPAKEVNGLKSYDDTID